MWNVCSCGLQIDEVRWRWSRYFDVDSTKIIYNKQNQCDFILELYLLLTLTSSCIPGHFVTTVWWHLLCTTHVQTESSLNTIGHLIWLVTNLNRFFQHRRKLCRSLSEFYNYLQKQTTRCIINTGRFKELYGIQTAENSYFASYTDAKFVNDIWSILLIFK